MFSQVLHVRTVNFITEVEQFFFEKLSAKKSLNFFFAENKICLLIDFWQVCKVSWFLFTEQSNLD